ncbi:MAG: D-2-hydroxyacid dehydrogenase [Alphaproteobacteria bacterium]
MSDRTVLVYFPLADELTQVRTLLDGKSPGIRFAYAAAPEEAEPYLADAEIFYGWGFPAEMLTRMPKLRWVAKMGAGIDDIAPGWPFDASVILTRTDGRALAQPMAEFVLAALFGQSQRLAHAAALQAARRWEYYMVGSLHNKTVGVAGIGDIGAYIAERIRPFARRVIGWRRHPSPSAAVDEVFAGREQLHAFAAACDALVLVLPMTKDTANLFDARIFAAMKRGAYLVNVGRGGVVDEEALLEALRSGRLAGAMLDVFATEPLPADHPLWTTEHVIVTPHVSGPLIPELVVPYFLDNLAAYCAGRPLKRVVDPKQGY